jgi:hypothetical protein
MTHAQLAAESPYVMAHHVLGHPEGNCHFLVRLPAEDVAEYVGFACCQPAIGPESVPLLLPDRLPGVDRSFPDHQLNGP